MSARTIWTWFWNAIVSEFPIWLTYVVGIAGAIELVRWWRMRPYRGWTVTVVRPEDGQESDAMRLAPDEVRMLEQSDLERARWIKSLISNFGRLGGLTPREILEAEWFTVDRAARRYRLDLARAAACGHLCVGAREPALAPGDREGPGKERDEGKLARDHGMWETSRDHGRNGE